MSRRLMKERVFSLKQIKLEGWNASEAPYYGFQSKYGTWKITDASGDSIENGDITLSGGKGAQKVTAQKEGTYYLTYFIDEDQYHTITNMNHYATNQTVTRPTVKFTVEKVPVNNNTSDQKKMIKRTIQAGMISRSKISRSVRSLTRSLRAKRSN